MTADRRSRTATPADSPAHQEEKCQGRRSADGHHRRRATGGHAPAGDLRFQPRRLAPDVLNRMLRARDRVLTDVWSRRAARPAAQVAERTRRPSPRSSRRRPRVADERSRVAAVFINRLRLNMKLAVRPDDDLRPLRRQAAPPAGYRLTSAETAGRHAVQHLCHRTGCRPVPSPIRDAPRSRPSPTRPAPAISSSLPTAHRRSRLRRDLRGAPAERRPLAGRERSAAACNRFRRTRCRARAACVRRTRGPRRRPPRARPALPRPAAAAPGHRDGQAVAQPSVGRPQPY